jgi:serine/threonine protein kinase
MEINIGPNYSLEKKIGKGAFGEVYEGKSTIIQTNRQKKE